MKKWSHFLLAVVLCLLCSSCHADSEKKNSTVGIVSSSNIQSSSEVAKSVLFGDVTDYAINNPKTYTATHFNFSVDYPATWTAVEDQWQSPTSSSNGSPDGGITIYVEGNKNEKISITGQYGSMGGMLSYPQEDFITKNMLKGKISYSFKNNIYQINMVLDENHHGAGIYVSEGCFIRNKAQILGILKSITVFQK